MTSGQGSGPETGQPPYGQPPQGQPPYGSAPPSAPPYPHYGQPGPGYQPAPSAPTDWGPGAPTALERPVSVRAGLGALIAALVVYAVSQVVTILNWDTVLAAMQAAQASSSQAGNVPFDAEDFAGTIATITIGLSVVMALAYLLFIWFAWQGRNWSRIVLWVLSGLFLTFGLIGGLLSAGSGISSPVPFVTALGWFQTLFLAVGIVLLALKPSNDWYRYRGWLRATGQPG